ncbi:MAG: hypothetical protein E6K17_08630 [Methanobacteriota archaeon]|nr:MAG: hypothetical protein E6K17_08630 [Euryarchaeota archaeon]
MIITLTTDFGLGTYVASMKGVILEIDPDAKIVAVFGDALVPVRDPHRGRRPRGGHRAAGDRDRVRGSDVRGPRQRPPDPRRGDLRDQGGPQDHEQGIHPAAGLLRVPWAGRLRSRGGAPVERSEAAGHRARDQGLRETRFRHAPGR